MKPHIDCTIRFTTQDQDLLERFRSYLKKSWNNQRGAQAQVIKRAVREFLDREEKSRK